jgi:hypothetical protein
VTLDMLKQTSDDVSQVIEAAHHKRRRSEDSVDVETFDPAVSDTISFKCGLAFMHV